MNRMHLVAAAALIGLAGCGGSGETDNNQAAANGSAEPANEAAPEANAAAGDKEADGNAAASDKPAEATADAAPRSTVGMAAADIRAQLIGRWGPDGDCADATEFRADNSFASAQLGDGRWEQSNAYFTLTAGGETVEIVVQELGPTAMVTQVQTGRITRWTRC